MVFAGIFPIDSARYVELREALEKLALNDSSFTYEPETSLALGFGFRCGFLGLLHMEIVQERLEREYNLDLIITAPTVRYRIVSAGGEVIEIDNPATMPDPGKFDHVEEPIITATVHVPQEYVGNVITLCQERRGMQTGLDYVGDNRVIVKYDLPLGEVVFGFYDKLKTISRGYASLDYELKEYREARSGAPRPARQRRARRRAVDHHAPRPLVQPRARAVHQDEGARARPDSSRSRSRRRSARASSRAPRSRRCARTSPRSVTAATSRASGSCSRSRRKARSG